MPCCLILWHQDKYQLCLVVQFCGIRTSPSYAWQANSVESGQVPAMPGSPILWHQDKYLQCLAVQFCGIRTNYHYAWQSYFVASGQSKLRLAVQFCGIRTVPDMPGSQIYGSNVQYKSSPALVCSGQIQASIPCSPSMWQSGPVRAIPRSPSL